VAETGSSACAGLISVKAKAKIRKISMEIIKIFVSFILSISSFSYKKND
jgi:hypothetical protein